MKRTIVLIGITTLLAGCGGGANSARPMPDVAASAPASPHLPAAPTTATASLRIAIPAQHSAASDARRTRYVSAGANWLVFKPAGGTPTGIDISATSSACTPASGGGRTCVVNAPVPTGTNVQFSVALFADSTATAPLSIANATQPAVAPNTTNPIDLTLNAVVGSLAVALSPAALSSTVTTSTVTVTALDPSGATIVIGSESLADANNSPVTIQLADADTSSATSLSAIALTNPATTATLTYKGTGTPNGTTITATAKNASGQTIGAPASAAFTVAAPPAGQHLYVESLDLIANTCRVEQFPLYNGTADYTAPSNSFTLASTPCSGLAEGPDGSLYVSAAGRLRKYAAGASGANPAPVATSAALPPNWSDQNASSGSGTGSSGTVYSNAGTNATLDVAAVPSSLGSVNTVRVCSAGPAVGCTGLNGPVLLPFTDPAGTLYAPLFAGRGTPNASASLYVVPQGKNSVLDPGVTSLTGSALNLYAGYESAFGSDGTQIYAVCECTIAGGPKSVLVTFPIPANAGVTAVRSATSASFTLPGWSSFRTPSFRMAFDQNYLYLIVGGTTATTPGRVVWVFSKSNVAATSGPIATLNLDTAASALRTKAIVVGP